MTPAAPMGRRRIKPAKIEPSLRHIELSADRGMRLMGRERGMVAAVARGLNLRHGTVQKWKRVPLEHVFRIGMIARISVIELRPDFFINDPLRKHLVSPQMLSQYVKRKPLGPKRKNDRKSLFVTSNAEVNRG